MLGLHNGFGLRVCLRQVGGASGQDRSARGLGRDATHGWRGIPAAEAVPVYDQSGAEVAAVGVPAGCAGAVEVSAASQGKAQALPGPNSVLRGKLV